MLYGLSIRVDEEKMYEKIESSSWDVEAQ